jgi:hypothetical protein
MSKDYEGYNGESTPKYISSKFEYDLFDDEDNKVNVCVRIKRITSPTEKWRFYENKKNTITIESSELKEDQIKFIRTVEGINYCISFYKNLKERRDIKNKLLANLANIAPKR